MKTLRLMACSFGSLVLVPSALADWSPVRRITWTSGGSYYPASPSTSFGQCLHAVLV